MYEGTEDWRITEAVLSPDGQHLALVELRDTEQQERAERLLLKNRKTGEVGELWGGPGIYIINVHWAPNSAAVLWQGKASSDTDAEGAGWHLCLATVPAFEVTSISTPEKRFSIDDESWAPDSKRVVGFALGREEVAIYVIEMATGNTTRIVSMPGMSLDSLAGCTWSPDGRWIAFGAYAKKLLGAYENCVYFVSPGGGEPLLVLGPTSDEISSLSWSPSGHRLAFVRANRIEIRQVEP